MTLADADVVHTSRRDADNNVVVYFDPPPSDGSKCWWYVNRLRAWDQVY